MRQWSQEGELLSAIAAIGRSWAHLGQAPAQQVVAQLIAASADVEAVDVVGRGLTFMSAGTMLDFSRPEVNLFQVYQRLLSKISFVCLDMPKDIEEYRFSIAKFADEIILIFHGQV